MLTLTKCVSVWRARLLNPDLLVSRSHAPTKAQAGALRKCVLKNTRRNGIVMRLFSLHFRLIAAKATQNNPWPTILMPDCQTKEQANPANQFLELL